MALSSVRPKAVVPLLLIHCLLLLPLRGFCVCSLFYYATLCVLSNFAIILIGGERELVVLLVSRCCGFVYSVWLWYFLIISSSFLDTNCVSEYRQLRLAN